jgi:hypothetical protein
MKPWTEEPCLEKYFQIDFPEIWKELQAVANEIMARTESQANKVKAIREERKDSHAAEFPHLWRFYWYWSFTRHSELYREDCRAIWRKWVEYAKRHKIDDCLLWLYQKDDHLISRNAAKLFEEWGLCLAKDYNIYLKLAALHYHLDFKEMLTLALGLDILSLILFKGSANIKGLTLEDAFKKVWFSEFDKDEVVIESRIRYYTRSSKLLSLQGTKRKKVFPKTRFSYNFHLPGIEETGNDKEMTTVYRPVSGWIKIRLLRTDCQRLKEFYQKLQKTGICISEVTEKCYETCREIKLSILFDTFPMSLLGNINEPDQKAGKVINKVYQIASEIFGKVVDESEPLRLRDFDSLELQKKALDGVEPLEGWGHNSQKYYLNKANNIIRRIENKVKERRRLTRFHTPETIYTPDKHLAIPAIKAGI